MSQFQFKKFTINQSRSALKVGTDVMLLGAFIDCKESRNALDIGTGAGVLSMMIAQKNTTVQITAVEIDSESCLDAKENFENGPFAKKLNLINGDILELVFEKPYDLIFTNPPFYEDTLKSTNSRINQAKHADTLNSESLCVYVNRYLAPEGDFWLIWPSLGKIQFQQAAQKNGLFLKKEITIEGKPNSPVRSIMCFSKNEKNLVETKTLVVRNENGNYTEDYQQLTKEFHNRKV